MVALCGAYSRAHNSIPVRRPFRRLGLVDATPAVIASIKLKRGNYCMFMAEIVRCPYCVLGNEFRPMVVEPGGWFFCDKCRHTVMPGNIEFRCRCQK